MSTFLLFSVLSAGPQFVEMQKQWQTKQHDVTTPLTVTTLILNY